MALKRCSVTDSPFVAVRTRRLRFFSADYSQDHLRSLRAQYSCQGTGRGNLVDQVRSGYELCRTNSKNRPVFVWWRQLHRRLRHWTASRFTSDSWKSILGDFLASGWDIKRFVTFLFFDYCAECVSLIQRFLFRRASKFVRYHWPRAASDSPL